MKAKQLRTYQLHTKTPHDKLPRFYMKQQTLFSIGGPDIMLLFTVQEHFGHSQKVKLEDFTLSNK